MAGLNKDTPIPTDITLHQSSRRLEIVFNDGSKFQLPYEYLRVYSPSAEVRGHGPGQEILQLDKQHVNVVGIEPIGNYAIQPSFSDGHNTGIYSWDYLYRLGQHQDELWADYLRQLVAAGHLRSDEPA